MTDVVTEADTRPQADKPPVHTRTVIIGTGFSGLGMAIALQKQGVDFVILEKADDVGGTWRDNTYPGCACDIPSHLYSYSFEPKPDWKNPFSYQPEIWDYLKGVTEKYGLRRYIEFNSLVDRGVLGRRGVPVARVHHRRARIRRPVPGLRRRRVARPVFPRDRRPQRIRRSRFPFRGMGPHRRPDRQAGRDHRNRRERDPDRARDRRPGCRTAALPAHPAVGGAAVQPGPPAGAASGHGERPRAARADTSGHLLGPGGAGLRHDQAAERAEVHRGLLQIQHPPVGEGPRAAPQADPALSHRVQANPELLHLLRRRRGPQDPIDHRRHQPESRATASSPPTAPNTRWT